MALLDFDAKYIVQSEVSVNTNNNSLQDDTEASQTFTLTGDRTVLVIYQANNLDGETESKDGKQVAISIDGADSANNWDSGAHGAPSLPCHRVCTFWIGILGSGSHTIKGRFSSQDGTTVTISNRILLIYILTGDEFQYVDDANVDTTTTGTVLVDDPHAAVTFTPSGTCKALYLYNMGCAPGAVQSAIGSRIAISVGGSDFGLAKKSPYSDNKAMSALICYAGALPASAVTVKGRWALDFPFDGIFTCSISRRQLGVLLFADKTLIDVAGSDVEVTSNSTTLVDDTEVAISRALAENRELLVIASGSTAGGLVGQRNSTGECYGIMVNSVDKQNSRGCPNAGGVGTSASTCWAELVVTGTQSVKGRWCVNAVDVNLGFIGAINFRTVVALWFGGGGGVAADIPAIPLGFIHGS